MRTILTGINFVRMKKTVIFCECGTWGLCSETALARALDEGEIAGAGLDVLKGYASRNLEKTNLCHRPNVILTPHSAFYSKEVNGVSRRNSGTKCNILFWWSEE